MWRGTALKEEFVARGAICAFLSIKPVEGARGVQCLVGEGAAGVRLGHWESVNKRARGVPGVAVGARGCKEAGNGGDD